MRILIPSSKLTAVFSIALCGLMLVMLAGCGSVDANDDVPEPSPPDTTPDPAPAISVSETALGFGEVETGESEELDFAIENDGDGELSGSVRLAEGEAVYSISAGRGSFTLGAGETLEVTVAYAPEETGEHEGLLEVIHDAENGSSPVEVSLSGEGIIPSPPDRP